WSHLVPLQVAPPQTLTAKAYESAKNALRRAAASVQNQAWAIRNFYRVQYGQHGTVRAIKHTARRVGKALYQIAIDQQRYSEGIVDRLRDRGARKNNVQCRAPSGDWIRQSSTTANKAVSVIIPTKNAGVDFSPLLSMLKNQEGFKHIEIIIVDSGSTDQTLKIAREFAATIIEIAPAEFSHSYARNLGAERATGDYVLFMVQDALPPSVTWLQELQ